MNNKHVVMPLKNMVLFSGGHMEIDVDNDYELNLKKQIDENDGYAVALTIKNYNDEDVYTDEDFYLVGNLVRIEEIKKTGSNYKLKLNVLERVQVNTLTLESNHYIASYERLDDLMDIDSKAEKDILDYIKKLTEEVSQSIPGSESFVTYINKLDHVNTIMGALMPYINISTIEKQSLLEMVSLQKKSLRFLDVLIERRESIKFQVELNSKISYAMNKSYRERMLREQMSAIQDELGEGGGTKNKKDYRTKVIEAELPEMAHEMAMEEVEKLERMGPNSSEVNVIRSYLDLVLSLPWNSAEIKDIDIDEARDKLNLRHYGLDKVKDRIIQHLTVMKLKKNKQGSILLLVGPPGTGKTSLAKSIAQALDREYVRISLGGVRDEAEIRGHRRTYVGAMPGKIIKGMKLAGKKNPVFVLDEIDKLMVSNSGDPASALLEVLDPEQNNTFSDHYLDVPYDLSDVFFIATANDLRTISGPLRDRMEIIQIGSYTTVEKFHIASEHLFEQSLEEHGLTVDDIKLSDNALRSLIDKYTREAGVRSLKRQLDKLIRISSEKIVTGKVERPYRIKENMLRSLLGHEMIRYDLVKESNIPGVVTGLAWTPVGGDILYIESAFIPGRGSLLLTGQLGDVMKESARISLSLIKSRLHTFMTQAEFDKLDLHIHVPAGSTPKDGPSAGVTILTTIASLISNRPVDSKLAMTGEISLRGAVLPVGGIKEKIIAAHRSGIRKIILPFDNQRDLEDIPVEVKNDMTFVFVKTVEEVLVEALGLELPEPFTGKFEFSQNHMKTEIGFNM